MERDVNLDTDEIAKNEVTDSEETVPVEKEDLQDEQIETTPSEQEDTVQKEAKADESYPTVENVVPREQEDNAQNEKPSEEKD